MSHNPQRIKNDCLNCGTLVIGKYCHNCGQENKDPKESLWQLLSHFFSDITHFDGKIFSSIKDLVLKPGFLSNEYLLGKRASYLNPIRMYLFTSFIFFLVFFSLYKADENTFGIQTGKANFDKADSLQLRELSSEFNNGKPLTNEAVKKDLGVAKISIQPSIYKSIKEYDSLIKAGVVKDNWLVRKLTHKSLEIDEKYPENKGAAIAKIVDKFQHSIPQMLFILLPLFALCLKLLYSRHKNYYYTDHAIFTIHFYIFVFIELLVIFGISKIQDLTGALWLQYINLALVFVLLFYLYKSMRNFYKQNRFKTILKYTLLLCLFSFIGVFLFVVFSFISLFEI